jgi:hypothetical protein
VSWDNPFMGKVIAILLVLGGAAHADDAVAGAKAVLKAQMTDDQAAFGKTFAADGLLMLDDDVVVGPDAASKSFQQSASLESGEAVIVSRKLSHVSAGAIGTDAAWITADVAVKAGLDNSVSTWIVSMSELVVRDGDGWKVKAAQIAEPVKDKQVTSVEDGAKPSAIPDAKPDADHEAALAVDAIAAALASDKTTTVIGTAPKERATGAAKAKKLLKKWAKLSFSVNGGVRWVDGGAWTYAAARVDLAAGKATLPYRVLVIIAGGKVVCAHFAFAGAGG